MHRLHISLTDEQWKRLKGLKEALGFRTFSNTVGRLVDLKHQERITETAGAQNPEPGPAPQGQRDEIE